MALAMRARAFPPPPPPWSCGVLAPAVLQHSFPVTIKNDFGLVVDGLHMVTPTSAHKKLSCIFFLCDPGVPALVVL